MKDLVGHWIWNDDVPPNKTTVKVSKKEQAEYTIRYGKVPLVLAKGFFDSKEIYNDSMKEVLGVLASGNNQSNEYKKAKTKANKLFKDVSRIVLVVDTSVEGWETKLKQAEFLLKTAPAYEWKNGYYIATYILLVDNAFCTTIVRKQQSIRQNTITCMASKSDVNTRFGATFANCVKTFEEKKWNEKDVMLHCIGEYVALRTGNRFEDNETAEVAAFLAGQPYDSTEFEGKSNDEVYVCDSSDSKYEKLLE